MKKYIKVTLKLSLTLIILTAAASCAGCRSAEPARAGGEKTSSDATSSIIPETDSREIRNRDASALYYSGKTEEAVEMYKSILKHEKGNRKASLSLAMLLFETGNYREALSYISDTAETNSERLKPGTVWEDPLLPVFLSGNSEEYLEKINSEEGIYSKQENAPPELQNEIISERLFFTALAWLDTGNRDKAVEMLEKALSKRGYFPIASLLLGQLYFEKNEFALAAKNLNTALKNDSNQTAGRVTLAKTILAGGRLSEGHAALKRAAAIRPWDRETGEFLRRFEENNPDIVSTKKAVEEKRRLSVSVPEAKVFTPEPDKMPSIRVGLAENLRELHIKPGGDFRITDKSGTLLAEGKQNQVLKITSSYRTIFISSDDGKPVLNHQGETVITCNSPSDTILMFNVVHSTGYLSAGREDRSYRGTISLKPSGGRITVINTLPLEEYLYSVVPSEIPSYWPEEALCAQAVAARSYTLANMGKYRKKGYDVTGSIKSHFYRGFTGENEKTTSAVEKTRGIVLRAEGKYLNAFYSANSAGRTESAESVWGGKYPLLGVTDPQLSFETEPPAPYELARWILSEPESFSSHPKYYFRSSYRWRLIVPADEIEARTGNSVGDIISVTTAGRGKSGRVERILIKGTAGEKIIRGDKIRKSLGGLRSSLFIMMPKLGRNSMPEYFIFAGAGWGHGVGMCQTGAAGMAHEGYTHQQILNHYYPAAEIVSIY